MKTSKQGKIEILGHESIALSKYKDSVGVWTIGAGATRSEIPNLAAWPLNKTITIKEAIELFESGLVKYENAINKVLNKLIPQQAFDALVSWAYNVGTGWAPKSTIMRLIRQFKTWASIQFLVRQVNKGDDEAVLVKKWYSTNLIKRLPFPNGDFHVQGNDILASNLWHALMSYHTPIEITRRRSKEARLLVTGQYSNNGIISVFPVTPGGYPQYHKAYCIDAEDYLND